MIKLWMFLFLIIPSLGLALPTTETNNTNPTWLNPKSSEFMTSADMLSATLSNISIKNIGAATTVTGIYLFVIGTGNGDACTTALFESEGNPFGTLWSPTVTIDNNETKYIGANYLYNMMMFYLYQLYAENVIGNLTTPGTYSSAYCFWIGITNQTVNTDSLTSTNGSLNNANQLVQYIAGDLPISFTNITCNDSTRLCSTTDNIQPQPFPHQRP